MLINQQAHRTGGYIEFFKHADNYVTVKYYQDGNTKVYIGQFILGESNWKIVWS